MENDPPINSGKSPKSAFQSSHNGNGTVGSQGAPKTNSFGLSTAAAANLTRHRGKAGRWQRTFLQVFKQTGIVRAAAEAAGIDRTRAYQYRDKNPKFAAEWEKAIADSTELLELHCLQRATQGETEDVWMNTREGPKKVGTKKIKSDRLLEFMLRARKPMVYRDTVTQEITGPGGAPLAPVIVPQTVVFNIPNNSRNDPAHAAQAVTVREAVDLKQVTNSNSDSQ